MTDESFRSRKDDPEIRGARDEEARLREEKANAKVKRLLVKHELELDAETEEILKSVIASGSKLRGAEKLIDKDFIIMHQVRMLYDDKVRVSTKQRILEFLAEMNGLMPQGAKGISAAVAELAMESLNEK